MSLQFKTIILHLQRRSRMLTTPNSDERRHGKSGEPRRKVPHRIEVGRLADESSADRLNSFNTNKEFVIL
jgi:hypothetical protein